MTNVVVYSLSHVWLFMTPLTVAYQAPLSMGFSRQEYWTGLLFPGDLPDPGIKPRSPALQKDSLPSESPGKPIFIMYPFKSWALPHMGALKMEKAMAPHSSTLAWKIPWAEEPGRLQSMGSQSDTTEWLHFHFSLSCMGEGNGNPLQYSCLENPRDRGSLVGCHLLGRTESDTTEVT